MEEMNPNEDELAPEPTLEPTDPETPNIPETLESPEPATPEHNVFDDVPDDHRRVLILGNSGSGKTVLAWYTVSQAPAVLFINPQNAHLPDFAETTEESYQKALSSGGKYQVRPGPTFDMEEFITTWHAWASTDGQRLPFRFTLVIDEISLFGVRGKLSAPGWFTTILSRSRIFYNVVLINHSTYQIPSWAFNQCSYIFFMRTGSSSAEQHYQGKWFTPLSDEFYREILNEKYYFVIHDINADMYQAMKPIEL